MNDYGARASSDLIVTRGDGFRKEKNKKKRGSYKGGDITVRFVLPSPLFPFPFPLLPLAFPDLPLPFSLPVLLDPWIVKLTFLTSGFIYHHH